MTGKVDGATGPNIATNAAMMLLAIELIGQHRPAEHDAGQEHVEQQIADVGAVGAWRTMRFGNSARSDGAPAHAAAALDALPDEEQAPR